MGRLFLVPVNILLLVCTVIVTQPTPWMNEAAEEAVDDEFLPDGGERARFKCIPLMASKRCNKYKKCCNRNCVNGTCQPRLEILATSNADLPLIYDSCNGKMFRFFAFRTTNCVFIASKYNKTKRMDFLSSRDCNLHDRNQNWTAIRNDKPQFQVKHSGSPDNCINVANPQDNAEVGLSTCKGTPQTTLFTDNRRDPNNRRFQLQSVSAKGKCVSADVLKKTFYIYPCSDEFDTQWFIRDGC